MRFTKMHGLGNDYVYVDCFRQKAPANPSELSIAVANRRRGIGSDGLILILPSDKADAMMRIFNADGSEAMMCGNGIRCVGKYLYDSGLCKKDTIRVDTLSGIKVLKMQTENGIATGACVDMGEPTYGKTLRIDAPCASYDLLPVSMGNPHAVTFLPELPSDAVFAKDGAYLEKHDTFPEGVNAEFCAIPEKDVIDVRVWERGSGETAACGTGACAVLVAACVEGLTGRSADVRLPGGTLRIDWNEKDNHVYMTGPATTVFSGEWPEGE